MRKYLATIHEKPDHHKKQFAFVVSGTFTLFIFVVWSLVNYGLPMETRMPGSNTVAIQEYDKNTGRTPFGSLSSGVAAAIKAIGGGFGEVKEGLKQVEINTEYQDMRDRAFETYGR